MLKKFIKNIVFFLLFLILTAIVYISAEFILSRVSEKYITSSDLKYKIFIKSNGLHTDIVLPIKSDIIDWVSIFPLEDILSKNRDFDFISIGWGDKGFYLDTPQWKDLKLSTALIAGTGIGSTALHITFYKNILEDELTYSIDISKEQYKSIVSNVQNSLQYKDGEVINIKTSSQYGQDDSFYEAKGSYSIFHTCNTWTNNILKEAKLPSSKWVAFDDGILYQYKRLQKNH